MQPQRRAIRAVASMPTPLFLGCTCSQYSLGRSGTLKKSAPDLSLARNYKYFKDISLFLFTRSEGAPRCRNMSDFPGAGVSCGCKLPNVGAGN